jgi:hypothetical protein
MLRLKALAGTIGFAVALYLFVGLSRDLHVWL